MTHLVVNDDRMDHGQCRPEPFSSMALHSDADRRLRRDHLGELFGTAVSAPGDTREFLARPAVFEEPRFAFFAHLNLPGAA
jgi:hypothetical protein